ncbi:MAG: protease HtpX [Deltaproteobacteria bacterium]|nr:protease HtpX [Deltaproteobacteria bacterium]
MLSIILNLLGIRPYLDASGINYESLFLFCLVWGTGGAFISLWISKWMAKSMYGVQIIDRSSHMGWLVNTIHEYARRANLEKMPEVGIYESPEMNAFATGPSKNNAMVAVSTGLLHKMSREEVEGVVGHEVAHIANGDMVTMTLLQGVMNAFVMFFARIVAHLIDSFLRGDREGGGLGFFGYIMTVFFFEAVFGLIGQMVTSYFSRHREFRADKGGARFAGREKMIAALEALHKDYAWVAQKKQEGQLASLQISSKSKFLQLLSTHPPLEVRIKALRGF